MWVSRSDVVVILRLNTSCFLQCVLSYSPAHLAWANEGFLLAPNTHTHMHTQTKQNKMKQSKGASVMSNVSNVCMIYFTISFFFFFPSLFPWRGFSTVTQLQTSLVSCQRKGHIHPTSHLSLHPRTCSPRVRRSTVLVGLLHLAANGVWLIMHSEVGKSSYKPNSQFDLEAVTVCSLCAANSFCIIYTVGWDRG